MKRSTSLVNVGIDGGRDRLDVFIHERQLLDMATMERNRLHVMPKTFQARIQRHIRGTAVANTLIADLLTQCSKMVEMKSFTRLTVNFSTQSLVRRRKR